MDISDLYLLVLVFLQCLFVVINFTELNFAQGTCSSVVVCSYVRIIQYVLKALD